MRKIAVEFTRGIRVLFSRPIENAAFAVSAPLWLAFFVLTLRGYGVVEIESTYRQLFLWVAYIFTLYSTWLWGFGHGIMDEGYDGVLEYVLATDTDLFTHMLGSGLSFLTYEAMDLAVIAASFYAIFRTRPYIANIPLFTASLMLFTLELLFLSSIYSAMVIRLRSSWVITNIMQFILPLLGGLIPGEANRYISYINSHSPIAYPAILLRESAVGIMEVNMSITAQFAYALAAVAVLGILAWITAEESARRLMANGQLGLI